MTAGEAHFCKIEAVLAADAELAEQSAQPEAAAERDAHFMKLALTLAQAAAEDGEVPVGCVIVRDGKVLSADYNGRETFRDAAYHAETAAISTACRKLGGWRLTGCTLYVTLEPCPMCAGAIWNARVPRVVIGAKDPKAGAMGSLLNLNSYPLNFKPKVTFGVCERECRDVLRAFFQGRRGKGEWRKANNEVRSGTSIGANIHEADYAVSKADFIAKLHIALKEAAETEYWLIILEKTGYFDPRFESLKNQCSSLKAILTAALKTAKSAP